MSLIKINFLKLSNNNKIILKSKNNFLINDKIYLFLKTVAYYNFKSWIVGGALRDFIVGQSVKDIDIAIDGNPKEILKLLKENKIHIENKFLNYGVFFLKFGKIDCNLTCLREDFNHDGRHSKVLFSKNLSADSKRRDLTINSLYLNIEGEIIDFYNGYQDIKNSKLNFIGDYKKKCLEDYLRIMRYIRFCSIFKNPIIPPEYIDFFKDNSCLLKKIPKKKLFYEFKKIFENKFFYNSIKIIKSLNLDHYFLDKILKQDETLKKKLEYYLQNQTSIK